MLQTRKVPKRNAVMMDAAQVQTDSQYQTQKAFGNLSNYTKYEQRLNGITQKPIHYTSSSKCILSSRIELPHPYTDYERHMLLEQFKSIYYSSPDHTKVSKCCTHKVTQSTLSKAMLSRQCLRKSDTNISSNKEWKYTCYRPLTFSLKLGAYSDCRSSLTKLFNHLFMSNYSLSRLHTRSTITQRRPLRSIAIATPSNKLKLNFLKRKSIQIKEYIDTLCIPPSADIPYA